MRIRYRGVEADGARPEQLIVSDAAPIATDVRTRRFDRVGRPGQHAGKDYVTKRVWELSLTTNTDSLTGTLGVAGALERAWLDRDVLESTDLVPLDYSLDHGATWGRVYGRPAAYEGPGLGNLAVQGVGRISLSFDQMDPNFYDADQQTVSLSAVPSFGGGGFINPFVFPLKTTGTGGERPGGVFNDGDADALAQVTFYGPGKNFRAWSTGFDVGYRGTLAHDQRVTIDPRSATVIVRGGGVAPRSRPGQLTPSTRLSELAIPPGSAPLFFSVDDPTGTARLDLTWEHSYSTMH